MNIRDWAELNEKDIIDKGINLSNIHPSVHLDRNVSLGAVDSIGGGSTIGLAEVKKGVFIGGYVMVGNNTTIDRDVTLLDRSMAGVASYLGAGSVLASGVSLPADAVVGEGTIIPGYETVKIYGPLGKSGRIMTIHGAEEGPRYSLAGFRSVDLSVLRQRFEWAIDTTQESAHQYMDNMPIFEAIGDMVQTAYDGLSEQVAELRGIRDDRIASRTN